ncbi:hypothetical protein N7516_002688 [Penicillium verrucosum]|uniref:uncharacterized protein n=1 Tax=Penicillium verrucosum TaxID=60171 RepID=UPI0025453B5F|nr:uncharacterized protein N7516_002688 [Penicillium verrucosum]KAJ5942520.1 hypothetical protein N7516_002688 [Penicillium verrucosum]
MSLQPPPIKNWPHTYDQRYVYKRFNIEDNPYDHQVVHDLAQEVFDIVAVESLHDGRALKNLFRSSYSRTKIQFEWRKRIPRLPAAVRAHVTDVELLTGALYKYLNCIQDELQKEFEKQLNEAQEAEGAAGEGSSGGKTVGGKTVGGKTAGGKTAGGETAGPSTAQQPSERSVEKQPEQRKRFNYGRPFIVPNGDIQIIRADHPDMPIAIRDICPDGDWINIANIKFEVFKENLTQEGYLRDGDTIWLHHLSLDQLDPALISNPQTGEVRLASFNLASTLLRTIREHWPKLRNPSPDPFRGNRRSPLPRPNMTVIIRSGNIRGGALSANQPAIARPTEQIGGNKIVPNRRSEQVARYAASKHAKTKRKRAEAEAAAAETTAGETGAETDAEMNAPAAQRRRLGVAHKIVAVPEADPAPGPSSGPAFAPSPLFVPGPVPGPFPGLSPAASPLLPPALVPEPGTGTGTAFAPAPGGQQQQEGGDEASFFELLRPIIVETGYGADYGLGQQPQEGGADDPAFQALLDPALRNTEGLAGDDSAAMQTFLNENEWAQELLEEGEPMEE